MIWTSLPDPVTGRAVRPLVRRVQSAAWPEVRLVPAVAMAAAAVSVAAIGAAMVTTISNQLAFGSALAETSTLLNGNAAEIG